MTIEEFQQLVRCGVRIRFRSDDASSKAARPTFTAKVASCNWDRGYVKVHMPMMRNPQKVPAWAIVDVPPDRTDIDAVEEWLARGPLDNPYQRPLRGPMVSFYVSPNGRVSMTGNTDPAARLDYDALLRQAQARGTFDRSNRQFFGAELPS